MMFLNSGSYNIATSRERLVLWTFLLLENRRSLHSFAPRRFIRAISLHIPSRLSATTAPTIVTGQGKTDTSWQYVMSCIVFKLDQPTSMSCSGLPLWLPPRPSSHEYKTLPRSGISMLHLCSTKMYLFSIRSAHLSLLI